MGKLKPRIKGKGKKWGKGQSSSSNPTITKFRDAARSRFFTPNLGTSRALTVGALKTHEAFLTTKPVAAPSEASESVWSDASSEATTATFQTFASEWSDCSNMSFSKLLVNFQPNSALHKEMLAVLAAVTEVIKAQGGTESSTEYFGALMTALEASESEDSTAAILSLLSMNIKSVPQEVLRAKFSEISKSFLDVLSKYSDTDNFVIIRALIGCLSVVLRAQDAGVWSYSSTHQVYHSILIFTIFTKPKVRKAAQHAVMAILKGSNLISSDSNHPAAPDTAKFCVQKIEAGATAGGGGTALHILGLLKEIISTFPKIYIKSSCEAILKLLTLGNVLMTSCCFQALHALFASNPPTTRLTSKLNAQLIHALYDYQPPVTDWQAILAWLTVIQEAYCHLSRIDPNLCAENLLKLFTTLTQLWLCDNSKIVANVTHTLRCVALDCFTRCSSHPNFPTIAQNVFSLVEEGLKYQYHNAWAQVLHLLAALFEALGPTAETFSHRCLASLADIRDSYNFPHSAELEFAVGKAIRTLGPEYVLKAIPLQITGKETNFEFKRSWLLPVLKENIQTASLDFYAKYFLSLAMICKKRSEALQKMNEAGSHTYSLLCSQIWALLPSFCRNPTDVATSFKSIAQTLGTVLSNYKDLRLSVMSSLRKIIQKCEEKKDEESLKLLGRYAKNYLPIFLNIYTTKPVGTDEEGQRLAALDTLKLYLTVTSQELCGELFDKASVHLEDSETDDFMKASILDLVKVFLPYLDSSRVEKVYQLCVGIFEKPQKTNSEEKKAFRLLEDLCSCDSDTCRQFMTGKVTEVQKRLLKSIKKQNTKNSGARLRCLRHLVRLIPRNQFSVIKTLVPEVVLRCKDGNARTRACAFDLLIEMFQISQEWSEKANDDLVRDYFQMIIGGLAGSPTLVSATLLGLARLTYLLKDQLPSDITQMLLESVSILLAEPTREITAACLSFIKTFLTAFPVQMVLPHLPIIVKSIASMTDDCKKHSRIKIRDVLDRLLRKFGYETVHDLIPSDDVIMLKRLNNLRKTNERKKRMKNAETEGDGDSDEDVQFSVKTKPKSIEEILASSDESEDEDTPKEQKVSGKKNKGQMYIKEDDDDIVDLVSPAAASKLSAKKPSVPLSTGQKKKETSFEMTSTGKLVIPRDIADDSSKKNRSHDSIPKEDSDSDVDDVASNLSRVEIGRKRKRSIASGSVRSETTAKYQAGGSGIHRPIAPQDSQKAKKVRKTAQSEDGGIKTGKEYRASKARGDVKIKGKPDPYAYIPLSRKTLNKRKKAKASGRFNNIIKSAVKGARAGAKAKGRKKN